MTIALRGPARRTRARAAGLWLDPSRRPVLIVWALIVAPLVWWWAHLLWTGWFPQGDEALVAIRTHDVFSTHPPLLGMRTTSSINTPGVHAHHPGPLEFYALALPYRLSGSHPWGLLLGCLLILIAFVTIALRSAHRAAGAAGVAIVAWAMAVLEITVGAALVLPLNTWTPMIGLLAVLVLGWRLLLGATSEMPWYAVCAAYVAQAHVSFAPLVGLLTVVLCAVGAVRWRRRREAIWPMPGFHPRHRAPWWRRRGWVTAYLTVLCWLPVGVEAFTGSPNNLTELTRVATAPSKATVGLGVSVRQFLEMLAPAALPDPGRIAVGVVVLLLLVAAGVRTWGAVRRRGLDPRDTDSRIATLIAVGAICAIPLIWMGSRLQGGNTLIYLALPLAAPLVLTGCGGWWVCSVVAARLAPQSPMRPGGLRVVAVLGVVVSLLVASHSSAFLTLTGYSTAVTQAREDVPRMADALNAPALRHRPIVVKWTGAVDWTSVAPALEAELVARGRHVYFDGVWPNPEYDEFRRIRNAPEDSVVVLLRERPSDHARWSQTSVPAASRTMTFDLRTGDGRGQVQLLIQRAPFSSSES